jgi:N6-adenosine-specific RNA methylase IME4
MKLVRYNAAVRALAQAVRADEAKGIRDKAVALLAYAQAAQDTSLVEDATRIRVQAETRTGELLIDMATEGARGRGRKGKSRSRATLSDLGISKDQSFRWRKLAVLKTAFPKDWETRLARLVKLAVAATEGEATVVREARAERQRVKTTKRRQRVRDLNERTRALPNKKYNVLLADPEWEFKVWSEKGKDRSAENHYNVSALPVIKSRPVEKISADDAVLFLWATVPMLPQALEVMTSWGFFYVSHFIWHKDKFGTGYWNRNRHELLLVGTRGHIPAPSMGTQYSSCIGATVGKHSEKPRVFYDMIDEYFPDLPKIELNCRGKPRPGWDGWGAETEMEREHESA